MMIWIILLIWAVPFGFFIYALVKRERERKNFKRWLEGWQADLDSWQRDIVELRERIEEQKRLLALLRGEDIVFNLPRVEEKPTKITPSKSPIRLFGPGFIPTPRIGVKITEEAEEILVREPELTEIALSKTSIIEWRTTV